ncbi:polysaccharide biosynthesis/export family protein [Tropicimonas sp. IMCC34043]|uniref:polysaccharide biosynthesis/export family protein n=1 Tax=Tropicimonas sp. IMCC34043 TaxID=2248760 RepID=UPI000E2548FE|nr:polysaccharide biosynthesis/export family protein [Tropicimonas sp. IMCC34043]
MIARIVFVLIALVFGFGTAQAQGVYQIQPGDTLAVEVLEDTTLNRQVLVLPDGTVNFPMAGTVRAGGRTAEQLERAITSRIGSNFSVTPTVYVSVVGLSDVETTASTDPNSYVVYLVGEVNEPGPKAVTPGTTFLQLLSQSGGFTKFAATKRLQLRRTDPKTGRQRMFKINYRAISQGAQVSTDPVLVEGDIVLIPERRLFE